ncbi:hypothetical protein BpHYR1_024489 [Brachionus plicatilis]|uniref:Uncharacterized protein n=1 Tax=Brachionus plicatilis TaxID=10195 RepID=A0A3M7PE31_BRAPC|nr:hypothetical protein BpHYR1_024489 [Brachionus plicatilis]
MTMMTMKEVECSVDELLAEDRGDFCCMMVVDWYVDCVVLVYICLVLRNIQICHGADDLPELQNVQQSALRIKNNDNPLNDAGLILNDNRTNLNFLIFFHHKNLCQPVIWLNIEAAFKYNKEN